jgi:hypothetical protein
MALLLEAHECYRLAGSNLFDGVADYGTFIFFPDGQLPAWAQAPRALEKDGFLVGVVMRTPWSAGLVRDLTEKYGAPTRRQTVSFTNGYGISSKAENLEWNRPGLRVQFKLLESQPDRTTFYGDLTVEMQPIYDSDAAVNAAVRAHQRKL